MERHEVQIVTGSFDDPCGVEVDLDLVPGLKPCGTVELSGTFDDSETPLLSALGGEHAMTIIPMGASLFGLQVYPFRCVTRAQFHALKDTDSDGYTTVQINGRLLEQVRTVRAEWWRLILWHVIGRPLNAMR